MGRRDVRPHCSRSRRVAVPGWKDRDARGRLPHQSRADPIAGRCDLRGLPARRQHGGGCEAVRAFGTGRLEHAARARRSEAKAEATVAVPSLTRTVPNSMAGADPEVCIWRRGRPDTESAFGRTRGRFLARGRGSVLMLGNHGCAYRYRVISPQNSHPPWLFRGLSFPQELRSIQHRLCAFPRHLADDPLQDVRQQFEPQPTRSTRGGHLCIHRSTSFCWRWVRFCSRASRTLGSRGRSSAVTMSRPPETRVPGVLGLEVRQLDILAHLAFLPFSRSGSSSL